MTHATLPMIGLEFSEERRAHATHRQKIRKRQTPAYAIINDQTQVAIPLNRTDALTIQK